MKKIFLTLGVFAISAASAQRIVDKAIVKMQTEIVFPENPGGPGGPGGPGAPPDGERMIMIGGGPGGMELSSTIYYKGDMTKIESTSDFGNNIMIMDQKNKKTTTLMEIMGKKMGFYSTEEDDKAMKARMDSVRGQRMDSLQKLGINIAAPPQPEIVYTEETKKIAGLTCKKAIIKTRGRQGEMSESTVWYCPDFKMGDGFTMSGGGMGRAMMGGLNGLKNINGFPMEYDMQRSNGMKVHMLVSKVELDASIDDKTFDIPKGYDIKPMSETQGPGGRMIFRMGDN
jgi:hypothetical protein